jgi:hypothetical protein
MRQGRSKGYMMARWVLVVKILAAVYSKVAVEKVVFHLSCRKNHGEHRKLAVKRRELKELEVRMKV